MKRLFSKIFLLFFIAVAITNCSSADRFNQGTTIVGNTSSSPAQQTISIGKLSSGSATITIPLIVFGDSTDDLTGATIDVKVNDEITIDGINAANYYNGVLQAVAFVLSSLRDGDVLQFLIRRSDGTTVTFTGAVTIAGNSTADFTGSSADGFTAFQNQNIAGAEQAYCGIFDSGSTDSQAAFGCYLAKLLSLLETDEAETILISLGEDPIDVEDLILDGVFGEYDIHTSTFTSATHSKFRYSNYADLPLHDVITTYKNFEDIVENILDSLNDSGTTAGDLQAQLLDLIPHFEYMESCLDVVLADSIFTFTIPEELFNTSDDMDVTLNDARFFMAKTKASIVVLSIQAAYDFGIDFEDILDASGDIDPEVLVADLNGTGEFINGVTVDTTPFMTMNDESLITGSHDRFNDALEYLIEALDNVDDGARSDLFNINKPDPDLSQPVGFFDDLLVSSESPGGQAINGTEKTINYIDLYEFFTDPPSAADVTSSDPFVYEEGKIKIVESYFEELFDDIVNF